MCLASADLDDDEAEGEQQVEALCHVLAHQHKELGRVKALEDGACSSTSTHLFPYAKLIDHNIYLRYSGPEAEGEHLKTVL